MTGEAGWGAVRLGAFWCRGWHGEARFGMAGLVRWGNARFGSVWCDVVEFGTAGLVSHGTVR